VENTKRTLGRHKLRWMDNVKNDVRKRMREDGTLGA
jgi:hypothetical protein